jgi:hypothetical protein
MRQVNPFAVKWLFNKSKLREERAKIDQCPACRGSGMGCKLCRGHGRLWISMEGSGWTLALWARQTHSSLY